MIDQNYAKLITEIKREVENFYKRYENKINKAHGIDHSFRVLKNCYKILCKERELGIMTLDNCEIAEVFIAALLHDVGRIEDEKGDHSLWSYEIIKNQIFTDFDEKFSSNKFWKKIDQKTVLEIIKQHSKKEFSELNNYSDCHYAWKILTDADRMDLFGPLGIFRSGAEHSERFSTIDHFVNDITDKAGKKYPLSTEGASLLVKEYETKTILCKLLELYRLQNDDDTSFLDSLSNMQYHD